MAGMEIYDVATKFSGSGHLPLTKTSRKSGTTEKSEQSCTFSTTLVILKMFAPKYGMHLDIIRQAGSLACTHVSD